MAREITINRNIKVTRATVTAYDKRDKTMTESSMVVAGIHKDEESFLKALASRYSALGWFKPVTAENLTFELHHYRQTLDMFMISGECIAINPYVPNVDDADDDDDGDDADA